MRSNRIRVTWAVQWTATFPCSTCKRACPPSGAAGTRTPDLRRARAALSQLSYGPLPNPPARSRSCRLRSVGAPGLEPGTSALSGPRSNQLSYAPKPRGHTRFQHTAPGRTTPGCPAVLPFPALCRRRNSMGPDSAAQPTRTPWSMSAPAGPSTAVASRVRAPRLGPPRPTSLPGCLTSG